MIMNHAYYLKRIWFTGPGIEESVVDFIDGLNIIYGANDTGKSWILDAFDYMCGSGHDSFVIDDDTGCNQVHLEVVTSQGTVIMHRMLHSTKIEVESTDPRIESHQYTEGKSNYPINRVWMTILGIGSGVKVIKNENADRQSITIRSIINLLCVPLERMNRRESIFHTEGSYYSRTVTKSTLLYFLTEDLYLEYKAHKSDAKLRQEQKVRNEIKKALRA